tara:strand:+ start:772 stop:1161 length:390 start_codon:yes stop_codon:yes gene_type:complete
VKPHIYIAGPMRGLPGANWDEFDRVRSLIAARGAIAISPADLDREQGLHPMEVLSQQQMRDCMKRDCTALLDCNAVALLPGWVDSSGARAEQALAQAVGIPSMPVSNRTEVVWIVHVARGHMKQQAVEA